MEFNKNKKRKIEHFPSIFLPHHTKPNSQQNEMKWKTSQNEQCVQMESEMMENII